MIPCTVAGPAPPVIPVVAAAVRAISSPDLPPGLDAFVHFSDIEADGYRALEAGDRVEFYGDTSSSRMK